MAAAEKNLTYDELQEIGRKLELGTATLEEELAFLEAVDKGLDELIAATDEITTSDDKSPAN